MSIFHRLARRHRFVTHTVQVQRCIAPELISLADRLFADDADGAAFRNALRPFFITERPRIAILKGEEIWFHLEGPIFDCGARSFPLGAQVFIDCRGWLLLDPVAAADLHSVLREAIDAAAYQWLIGNNLLDQIEPLRPRRNRLIDDEIALRQMAAAAGSIHPEGEPNNA
ncbi:hypothetical protein [Novosphingobium sp.]|uniref:hypothetical protein n=1 Tax=Novosphingobium sp. TaxID=1874826 RepID=UPI0025EAB2BF|nr:hypothetical protein [Novosphingobium sp.]